MLWLVFPANRTSTNDDALSFLPTRFRGLLVPKLRSCFDCRFASVAPIHKEQSLHAVRSDPTQLFLARHRNSSNMWQGWSLRGSCRGPHRFGEGTVPSTLAEAPLSCEDCAIGIRPVGLLRLGAMPSVEDIDLRVLVVASSTLAQTREVHNQKADSQRSAPSGALAGSGFALAAAPGLRGPRTFEVSGGAT